MLTKSTDLPQNKTLKIKQDDNKFFSRVLSKENAVANPSFRVYYGGVSGSIPFTWESQPGTPKHALFSDTSLVPPLTPPPSYYSKSNPNPIKEHSRSSRLLHALFRKMMSLNLKENNVVPSSSPSSSSSTSWSSSSRMYLKRSRFSTPSSSFDLRVDDDEIAAIGSKSSARCLVIGRESIGKFRGCYCW